MATATAITKRDQLANAHARVIAEQIETLKLTWRLELEYPLEPLAQQLRVQVRDEENSAPEAQVAEYTEALRNGAVFPPLVASADNHIIDGSTRLPALLAVGRTTAPVFVLTENYDGPNNEHQRHIKASMRLLGAKLNIHGKALTREERRKAVMFALRDGYRPQEIMQTLHVSRDYVRNIEDEVKAVERCERIGVADPETKLGAMQLRALGNTNILDDLFQDVVELAIDSHMPAPRITSVVEHISDPQKVTDHNEQRLFIAEERKTLEPQIEALQQYGKGGAKSSPPATISRALGSILKYKDEPQSVVEHNRMKKHGYLTAMKDAYAALGTYIQAQEDDISRSEQTT